MKAFEIVAQLMKLKNLGTNFSRETFMEVWMKT
jgi:hypothetical protein